MTSDEGLVEEILQWLVLQIDLAEASDENRQEDDSWKVQLRSMLNQYGMPQFDERQQAILDLVLPMYGEARENVGYRRGRLEVIHEVSQFMQERIHGDL